MAKRYGLPYMGSKSKIAEAIVASLPPRKHFVDLFCGGCAVTHCAMLSAKWSDFTINDIEPMIVELFLGAVSGKYHNETRWISHEDFDRLKASDPYVAYIWSFGNNPLKGYMYSRDIEPWKKALHYARVLKDHSLLEAMGILGDGSRKDVRDHLEEYQRKYISWLGRQSKTPCSENLQHLQSLERLEPLENLTRFQRLQGLQGLQCYVGDYQDVPRERESLIYCDIPYENTEGYSKSAFDHKRFYEWASKQEEPLIISSYEISDNRFVRLFDIEKIALINANDNSTKKHEGMFVPRSQLEWWKSHTFLSENCRQEQLTLF